MVHTLSFDELRDRATLRARMHIDRSKQFCDRHKWNVTKTDNGLEIDQFDTLGTTYLVVGNGHDHFASLRLRHARDGNMVEQAFPAFWGRHGRALQDKLEVTRLCSAPALDGLQRQLAVARLLLGLCRHCRAIGQPEIFGIIFPGMARTLTRIGWPPTHLDQTGKGRHALLLSSWTATPTVDWTLQEVVACLEGRIGEQDAAALDARAVA